MHDFVKLSLVLVLLSAAVSFIAYPLLPDRIITHWNAEGEANGYSGKLFGTAFVPILMLLLVGLFLLIPKIEVFKRNIVEMGNYYYGFALVVTGFMAFLHAVTIAINLGYAIPITTALMPALAVLFYCTSSLLKASKRTFFVGIRTPWTLASEQVWRKTHDRGAVLFKALAVLFLIAAFLPAISLLVVVSVVLGVTAYLFVYSYFEYRKLEKGGGRPVDAFGPMQKTAGKKRRR